MSANLREVFERAARLSTEDQERAAAAMMAELDRLDEQRREPRFVVQPFYAPHLVGLTEKQLKTLAYGTEEEIEALGL